MDIIRSHAKDGYELIRSKHLPQILADVALQHHGTMPIKYFYARALKMTDGELNIEDFSYPGPKPQTKIAGDHHESRTRARRSAARSPTVRPKTWKRRWPCEIIEERMDLEQFDECDVTMKDLSIIKETIVNCLSGVYHSRVQYPKLKIKHPEPHKEEEK